MKKFLLTVLSIFCLVPTLAHALSAEECTACNIAVVVKLGAMTQAEIYNPGGGSFETTVSIDSDGSTPREVTVKWTVPEPAEDPEPVTGTEGGEE